MDIYTGADWHVRGTRPENRIDDYVEAMFRKIEYMIEHYVNNVRAAAMLIGGDIFDKHDTADWLKERLIRILGGQSDYCDPWIGVVFGQHDQRYHTSDQNNTPLGVVAAGVRNLHILGDFPVCRSIQPTESPVHLYGASWGSNIPDPVSEGDSINILLIHRMITESGPLWPGQTDFITATELLKTYPKYHYIISGDNHKPFEVNYRMRRVLNCGSLMRSSIDQVEYVPGFFIIHTDTRIIERVPFPCEPSSKVFAVKAVEEEKERDQNIENFVASLKQDVTRSVSFERNLFDYVSANNVEQEVKDAIGEIMG
jgi:DNA repair exonuclease SbcCD nuclease subunit